MTVKVDVQNATTWTGVVPTESQFQEWIDLLTAQFDLVQQEVCLRIVDAGEISDLNHQYRQKDSATNVLSFPADYDAETGQTSLGDVVICASVVEIESNQQDKEILQHWAHLTIHGTLHLLGFDHETNHDADEMETIERNVLAKLGIADPYQAA